MLKYIFIFFIFLLVPVFVSAQVVISEVMYDIEGSDTGHEWVEVTNTSANAINIVDWKFFEEGSNHGLTLITGDANVPSGSSVILVDNSDKFFVDNSQFSGTVFDSSFSLKNIGELIIIRDADLNDINSLTYDPEIGGGGDGNSLQLISGSWSAATPTLGLASVAVESAGGSESSEISQSQNSSSLGSPSSSDDFPVEQRIFADAGVDRSVIVGADSLFEGKSLGLQKKTLEGARYIWNFGNGETKQGQNVLYYYQYPGEYVVMLNVSSGQYSASDRIIVNSYPAELVISKVDTEFVEIHNKSTRELNLSWWQLEAEGKRFIIPKDTIILSGKKLIFSFDVTGLDTSVKENMSILYPNGVTAVTFAQIKIPQKVVEIITKPPVPIAQVTQPTKETPIKEKNNSLDGGEEILQDMSQTASVISNLGEHGKSSGIYKWLLAIFVVIVISAGIIIFASSKRELGDDIEIIE